MLKVSLVPPVPIIVHEWNCVTLDSNFFDKVSKLTARTLTEISKQTIFELVLILHFSESSQLFTNFPSEDVLMTKQISNTV